MANQKGNTLLGIIIGILIVLIIGGAYYLLMPKPVNPAVYIPTKTNAVTTTQETASPSVQTADLKTYTNSQYGYSLKYPSNLNLISFDNQNEFGVTNKFNPSTNGLYPVATDEQYYEFDVMVTPAKGQTLLDIAANEDHYKTRADYTKQDYTLGGVQGYKFTDVALDSQTDLVEVIKNSNEYSVSFRYFNTKDPAAEAIYEQILASFKFTP